MDWLDNRMLYFRHQISLFIAQMKRLKPGHQHQAIKEINQIMGLSIRDFLGFKDWISAFREPQEEILQKIVSQLEVDITAYLDKNRPYLTRNQVQQMHDEGFTIGAHGLTHRKLGFIPKQEVKREIIGACQEVKSITRQEIVPFSFPQSAGNVDRRQLVDIRSQNPQIGLLFDTKDLRRDVPFMINRVWAERPLTPERQLHPLPDILTHAYQNAWVEEVLDQIRRILKKKTPDNEIQGELS